MRLVSSIIVVACMAMLVSSCFRDGYQCSSDTDCFNGEVCQSGECITNPSANNACRPASDEELCAAADTCQTELQVTDSCGTLRNVTCSCTDACVPDTVEDLCATESANCGEIAVPDSCGDVRTVNCGLCTAPEVCVDNQCAECAPPVCPENAQCGQVSNSCGDVVECGASCSGTDICIDYACAPPVIQPEEVQPGDRFGERIQITDTELLIGAPYADYDGFTDVGAIYVYRRNAGGWFQAQIIKSPVPEDDARFGETFDVSDGWLVAGTGTTIIEMALNRRGEFEFRSGIPAGDRPISLGIVGDLEFLVGFEDTGNRESLEFGQCSAMAGCSLSAPWAPPNAAGETERLGLGAAIDTAGEIAIVGAPYDNTLQEFDVIAEGSVYLLSKSAIPGNWQPSGWDTPMEYYLYENYRSFLNENEWPIRSGTSVAVTDDGYAVFGSPNSSPPEFPNDVGEVFFLTPRPDPYSHYSRYRGTSTSGFTRCGYQVEFTGPARSRLGLVSCLYERYRSEADTMSVLQRERTIGEVRLYVEVFPEWRLEQPALVPDSAEEFDHFGWALEANESVVFVGAPGRSDDRGAVYIYLTEDIRP